MAVGLRYFDDMDASAFGTSGPDQRELYPLSYALAQAARVRELRAGGMSIRQIERAVNLSHGTVQRILAQPVPCPLPAMTKQERRVERMRRADDKHLRSYPARLDAALDVVEKAEDEALRLRGQKAL